MSILFFTYRFLTLNVTDKCTHKSAKYWGGKNGLYFIWKNLLLWINKWQIPYILEGTEVIDGVDIFTYIVRYDLEIDFAEPRKAKSPPKKKKQGKLKKKR